MGADDKVGYEDDDGRKKVRDYTEFQYLQYEVEMLKAQNQKIVEALRTNEINIKTEVPYFAELTTDDEEEAEEGQEAA